MTLLILKLVFNVTIIHSLLYNALMLIFAGVDSHREGYEQNNNVNNNLCVMIKKNVQREIPLYE